MQRWYQMRERYIFHLKTQRSSLSPHEVDQLPLFPLLPCLLQKMWEQGNIFFSWVQPLVQLLVQYSVQILVQYHWVHCCVYISA